MKTKKIVIRDNLLIVVGCGGVFYQGIERMATWIHRRGDVDTALIDPDVVEQRNGNRQWINRNPDEAKVMRAIDILRELGVHQGLKGFVERATSKMIVKGGKPGIQYRNVVMITMPDNHGTRVDIHKACMEIRYVVPGGRVMSITGGNTLEDGYAYGCMIMNKSKTGDWMARHPDIEEEAEKEEKGETHAEGCGMVEDGEDQSPMGNQLTAMCVWELAERMYRENVAGEIVWSRNKENGNVVIRDRWVEKVERQEVV